MTGLGPAGPGDLSPAGPGSRGPAGSRDPGPAAPGELGGAGPGKLRPAGPGKPGPADRGKQRRPRPLLRKTIGEVLRRTRWEQGRSLADVAREARVSVPYLSEVERGRKEASSEVLAAICDALRIGLSDLLAGTVRELAGDHAPGAVVVRLGSVDGGPAAPLRMGGHPRRAGGQGDVVCLAA